MGGAELPAEAASAGEGNVDEKSQPRARYRTCWDRELAEANAPNIARTMRACSFFLAVGSATGMLVAPVWASISAEGQCIGCKDKLQPWSDVLAAHGWGLIPLVTNFVTSVLVFVVFSLPQLKGFVTHNYMTIVWVFGPIVWSCLVLSAAMYDPSRPYKGSLGSWAEVCSLPPSLTRSLTPLLSHSLPPYLSPSRHPRVSLFLSV